MPIQDIINDIKGLKDKTQRDSIFIYGARKSLGNASNRINAEDFHTIRNTLNDPINLPKFKNDTCDLVLSSPGGRLFYSSEIMNVVQKKFGTINTIIPHLATSSATLMAFSGTTLFADNHVMISDILTRALLSTTTASQAIKLVQKTLQRGNIVNSQDIGILLTMLNTMSSVGGGTHQPFSIGALINGTSHLRMNLDIKLIKEIDNFDNFSNPGVAIDYQNIDQKITDLMKAQSLSKIIFVSDIFHFARK